MNVKPEFDRSKIPYSHNFPLTERYKLDQLFHEAIETGKWFFSQSLLGVFWFSPEALQEEQLNGGFIFAAENWKLVPPEDYLLHLVEEQNKLTGQLQRTTREISKVLQWMESHKVSE